MSTLGSNLNKQMVSIGLVSIIQTFPSKKYCTKFLHDTSSLVIRV